MHLCAIVLCTEFYYVRNFFVQYSILHGLVHTQHLLYYQIKKNCFPIHIIRNSNINAKTLLYSRDLQKIYLMLTKYTSFYGIRQ